MGGLVQPGQHSSEYYEMLLTVAQVGKLKIGRNFHGMVAVEETFVNQYCQD